MNTGTLAAAEKQRASYRQDQLSAKARSLADRIQPNAGVRILAEVVTEATATELRGVATTVLAALPSGEPWTSAGSRESFVSARGASPEWKCA